MTTPASLGSLLRATTAAALGDVHVALPGRVEKYDSAKQMVDVQPLIKVAHEDEEGARVLERLPVVPNVPVLFPGAGSARITFPVKAGDTVLLVFSEASLEEWLERGGEVEPADDRRFSLADAVAIPGLRDFAHARKSAPTDRMTVGTEDGPQIHLDDNTIRLGDNGATSWVALADKVEQQLSDLKTTINGWTPVPNDGGAALKVALAALFVNWPGSTAASKVKAK